MKVKNYLNYQGLPMSRHQDKVFQNQVLKKRKTKKSLV